MKKNKEKASATIQEFLAKFSTAEACLQHLFDTRFGQGHVCPSCNKKAKWYRIQAERAYSCQWCGHHLHPTVGTPFEDSRTPLQLWFYAIYLFTTSRHGVPAKELERQLGVTYKTAWRMADLIRKHMAQVDDECYPIQIIDATSIELCGTNGQTEHYTGNGLDGSIGALGNLWNGTYYHDDPGVACDNLYYNHMADSGSFHTTLMFDPGTPSSIGVPLKVIAWDWSGASDAAGGWHLTSSSKHISANNLDTTTFPLWSRVLAIGDINSYTKTLDSNCQ